jgi:hypothetical protein
MELKTKLIIGGVTLLSAFAVGRYTVPEKVKIEIKTIEVEKVVYKERTDSSSKYKKRTVTTSTTKPTGETETKTETFWEKETEKKTDKEKDTDKKTNTDKTSETTRGDSKVTLSMLGGWDLLGNRPVYGGSITKPVLGPFTLGIWVLSSPSFGASIGLTF